MHHLVITVLGKDRVGIVESIAQLVFKHNGNWLGSSMSNLAGQFAGIFELAIADTESETLISELKQLDDLQFTVNQGNVEKSTSSRHLILNITANDRLGILKQVTEVLSRASANVIEMETHCTSAANWGSPLFEATIKADIEETIDVDELKLAIENIADDIMIDSELVQKF